MAYNRKNHLERIIEIQGVVLLHKRTFTPQSVIYEKYIKDVYHISASTFNAYLAINAKKQLTDLMSEKGKEPTNHRQMVLFE